MPPQTFEEFLIELALNYSAQLMDLEQIPIEDRGRLLAEQRRMLESLRDGGRYRPMASRMEMR